MPTTRELLQQLQYDLEGWPSGGPRSLLYHLNEAHRYMVSGDCEQHIKIDPATGKVPVISTVSGTLSYNAPSDCRKIWRVGIDAWDSANGNFFYNFYNLRKGYPYSVEFFTFRTYPYFDIPIQSQFALNVIPAQVQFVYDPDSTTNRFFLFYFRKPTEILSDSIEPDVPEQFHELLLDGVLARLNKKEYGDKNDYEYWKQLVKREYWKEMNSGAQSKTRFVPQRHC